MSIPFWKHGSFFRSTLYQLGKMETYLDLIQSSTFDDTSAYKNLIEKTWSNTEKAELYDDENEYYEETWITERNDELKSIFYSSFLISWHSFMEDRFNNLSTKLKVKYSDKGGFIGKYQIKPIHWNEFKTISKLRNKIVHASRGRLKYKVSYDRAKFKQYNKTNLSDFGEDAIVWIRLEEKFDATTCKYSERHHILRFFEDGLYIAPNELFSRHLIMLGKQIFTQIHADLYQMQKSSK
jgi:hypothetical protein